MEAGGGGAHVYRNILLGRRENPPYPLRLLSSNMDAFHSFSVGKGPLLENSDFSFPGDDFFNVHNRSVRRYPLT